MPRPLTSLLLLGIALLVSSCRSPEQASGPLRVVTSVAPLTNIVHNVGGERIALHGIIPEGTDSHTFEPSPSDAAVLAEADLILLNGLHLETPTEKLAQQNMKKSARLFLLGDHTITEGEWVYDFSFPRDKGNPNPHLWMNPMFARKYADLACEQLSQMDAGNRGYYQANLARYEGLLDRLDTAIQKAVQTIPENNRKLVTYHDSFAYFAPRYKMTVVGAVQPSDFKEPSPQDVAAIIEQVKKETVPAIFGSEVYPSKVLDQMGKEAGVKYVSTLRDDDLPGSPGAPEHTYVGMMLEDVRTMVTALGGRADALAQVAPNNTFEQH